MMTLTYQWQPIIMRRCGVLSVFPVAEGVDARGVPSQQHIKHRLAQPLLQARLRAVPTSPHFRSHTHGAALHCQWMRKDWCVR
jgi:hypothetical protein